MEEKIFDLLNNAKIDLDEYQITDLSVSDKKRLKKKVLQEVSGDMRGMKQGKGMKGRKSGWKFAGLAAAACLVVSIIAVGNSSTAARELFSETFQKIISGTGGKDGEYFKEIYTKIGKESVPVKADTQTDVLETEDSGVTMRVSDVYCDGYMMYYTLVLETDNPILTGEGLDEISTDIGRDGYVYTCSVKIDGEGEIGDIIYFGKEADGTYTSVQNCSFYAAENPKEYQNGDIIPVEIAINRIAGWDTDRNDENGDYVHTKAVRGDWKLSFQAVVDTSKNVEQKIGKEKNGVKIIKAVRSKALLNLEIELPDFSAEPFNDPYNDPDIWISDQAGKDMKWLGNYNKKRMAGTRTLYLSLLDDEGENYKLQIADKEDRRIFAAIDFQVKR